MTDIAARMEKLYDTTVTREALQLSRICVAPEPSEVASGSVIRWARSEEAHAMTKGIISSFVLYENGDCIARLSECLPSLYGVK